MFRKHFNPTFMWETPGDGGSGTATVQPPAAAQPAEPARQGQNGDGFWGMFPNVPNEHRPLLEPHIKSMQGHVTRLESQLAPFKPFVEAGMTPEAATGLLKFSNDFDADPQGMWLRIGSMLQERGVIDPELDLDHLGALLRGEDPGEDTGFEEPQGQPALNGLPPEVVEQIQSMQARLDQFEQTDQQREQQRQEQIQDRLLERQQAKMKETLVKAGYPEELLTDQFLVSAVIANRGNIEQATKMMLDTRAGVLKGFTETTTRGGRELDLDNVPGAGEPPQRKPKDSWERARAGANSELRRNNRAAAQE